MNVVVTIISATVGALLLLLPIFNRHVFHTIDTDEIVIDGRESLRNISALQTEGKFSLAIDSADALIDRYNSDSMTFYTPDVTRWDTVRAIATGAHPHRFSNVFVGDLEQQDIEPIKDPKAEFPLSLKLRIVRSLNQTKDFVQFYTSIQDSVRIDDISDLRSRLKDLQADGILVGSPGELAVKENLTPAEKSRLIRFHGLILEKTIFPQFLRKDVRRGTDWASQFIVQTAKYYIGTNYKAQFQLDDAIRVWNDLVEKHPQTVYAEVLFVEIGKALLSEGRKLQGENNPKAAELRYRQGIAWLERIEQNREIASRFPKYKYTDLQPGKYVNVDQASRAKSQIKENTAIYTTKQAQAEASGKFKDNKSGYYLEDAVRVLGECYSQLNLTDSARSQYKLILKFFPESDNLDDAQKLVADSYVRDGDLLLKPDSSDNAARAKANERYELAVKEYLTFANVYPQSELISENFIALGDAYNKLGRPADATKAFASALGRAKEAEDQAKVQLKIGNYYYERDRYAEAAKAYQIILNNFLSTEVASNAQFMLGRCFKSQGDTAEAIRNFGVILEHYKRSTFLCGAAVEIGDFEFRRGNYRDAEKAYGYYVYDQQNNLTPQMMFKIGEVWRKIAGGQDGDAREKTLQVAIEKFDEVVKLFGDGKAAEGDRAAVQMAEIYKELGNDKAARESTKRISDRSLVIQVMKIFIDTAGGNEEQQKKDYFVTALKEALNDEERAAAQYELGMVYADNNEKLDSALICFNAVLSLSTKTSRVINAKVGIARVYSAQKKNKEAIEVFNELLQNPKVSKELAENLQIQLYDALYKDGQTDKALEGFEQFVAEHPEHKQAALGYYRIGTIYAERKDFAKSQDKYQVIIDRFASSEMYDRAVLGVGEQIANKGDTAASIKYLAEFIKKNPDVSMNVNFHMKLAEMYQRTGKKAEAIAEFGAVIDLKPDNAYMSHASYRQGMLLKEEGNEKKAETVFALVRKEDKSVYRAAQSEIGKIVMKSDPERAIGYYKQIIEGAESAEDSVIAMIGIGDVYDEIKKYKQSAEMFEQVDKFYRGNDTTLATGAIVKWANALMNAKMYGDAVKVCNEMQKRYPDHVLTINTYYFEATSHFQLKQFGKARDVFETIIKLNRSAQLSEIAWYQLGDTYYFEKQYKSAIAQYGKYVEKYPKGQYAPRALYMQANCHLGQAEPDYAGAKGKFTSLVEQYPDFEEICVAKNYLGLCYSKLGQPKTAIKYYEQVINGRCAAEAVKFAKDEREKLRVGM